MRVFIALAFLMSSTLGYANFIKKEWQEAKFEKLLITTELVPGLETGNAYPMVRIEKENAIPVLLLHGVSANNHVWMDLAPELFKAGYDVWAVNWTANAQRNLQASGEKTVKEIVEYIYKETGKKVHIIGHSLGAVAAKIYTFGVKIDSDEGETTASQDQDTLTEVSSKVRSLVSIASPNGKDSEGSTDVSPMYKLMSSPYIHVLGKDLEKVIKYRTYYVERVALSNIELTLSTSRMPGMGLTTKTLYNSEYHKYMDYDLARIFRYAYAGIPAHLYTSTQRTSYAVYSEVFFNAPRLLPMAYIAAENDTYAPIETIKEEALGSDFMAIENGGQIDPLVGSQVSNTLEFLIKFLGRN